MTDSDKQQWPPEQYRLAPNDYLAAFGQAALVYNFLEGMMSNVFEHYMPVGKAYARKLFSTMSNQDRMVLLIEVVKEAEKDDDTLEAILYCIDCFHICTDNRNILAHSTYFNLDASMTLLVKRSK